MSLFPLPQNPYKGHLYAIDYAWLHDKIDEKEGTRYKTWYYEVFMPWFQKNRTFLVRNCTAVPGKPIESGLVFFDQLSEESSSVEDLTIQLSSEFMRGAITDADASSPALDRVPNSELVLS